MGWYDSFKGNSASVNLNATKGGNAAKSIGDAFVDMGRLMMDAEVSKDKSNLMKLQLENEQMKLDDSKAARADKATDKKFLGDISTLDLAVNKDAVKNAFDSLNAFYNPTNTTRQAANNDIKSQRKDIESAWDSDYQKLAMSSKNKDELSSKFAESDMANRGYNPNATVVQNINKYFADQFNSEARKEAPKFKSMEAFMAANPEVVKYADGATIAELEAGYNTKRQQQHTMDNQDKTLSLQEKKFNHDKNIDFEQIKLSKMKASNGGDGGGSDYPSGKSFKYDPVKTPKDIVSVVKSSLGMDGSLTSVNEDTQKKFNEMSTGINAISRRYNVTPLDALDMYLNPDKHGIKGYKAFLPKANQPQKADNDPVGIRPHIGS